MPLGPSVLLTRSPTAMAPTKAERRAFSPFSSVVPSSKIWVGLNEACDVSDGRTRDSRAYHPELGLCVASRRYGNVAPEEEEFAGCDRRRRAPRLSSNFSQLPTCPTTAGIRQRSTLPRHTHRKATQSRDLSVICDKRGARRRTHPHKIQRRIDPTEPPKQSQRPHVRITAEYSAASTPSQAQRHGLHWTPAQDAFVRPSPRGGSRR